MAVEVASHKVVDLLLGLGMQVLKLVHGTAGREREEGEELSESHIRKSAKTAHQIS